MIRERLLETAAMTILGDSLLCVLSPRRHVSLWMDGPKWWQRSAAPFVRCPTVTRLAGLAGIGFGLWLAWRQEPRVSANERTTPRRLAHRLEEALR